MKEILFVCIAAVSRSPTGARVFNENFERDGLRTKYTAHFVAAMDKLPRSIMQHDIDRAYMIIPVKSDVTKAIAEQGLNLPSEKRLELMIPDVYERDDEELIRIFNLVYEEGFWR